MFLMCDRYPWLCMTDKMLLIGESQQFIRTIGDTHFCSEMMKFYEIK